MKYKYQHSNSFFRKSRVILILLGVIPYLLIVYLFIYERIALTDMVILFSALALFSILVGFSLMRISADHLAQLAQDIRTIETGEAWKPITAMTTDAELEDIARNFNYMLKKLEKANREIKEQSVQLVVYAEDLSRSYEKIKDEEELRSRLSRYVGKNLVEKLIDSKSDVFLENERKEVSILFADIRSFSKISENLEAEEVLFMLNEFFSIMVDIVFRNNGVLDKFVGDQIMAVFGVIDSEDGGAYDAVKTSLEIQKATEELMSFRSENGKETFEIGIGINTGNAIIGSVGSENRMDYTVIGDCVNIASKLEQTAKGGEIIVGEETYLKILNSFRVEKGEGVRVANKTEPIICYLIIPQ
ncbi:MAG: adenylate/guanylate cyclase domain-containing protein [Deltaproteobacteria bacterium]|nr:adenylate/guanylate cyclase domain-containing protein [Deltaproteobacteria bacterium]